MKTLFTSLLIGFLIANANAQSNIAEIEGEIVSKLSNSGKVYTPSGKYARVFSGKIFSDCSIEIWQLGEPLKEGRSETVSEGACHSKIIIDFSLVTQIYSSETNFGYPCIAIKGPGAIQKQDFYSFSPSGGEEVRYDDWASLAIDDGQLVSLFEKWKEACSQN